MTDYDFIIVCQSNVMNVESLSNVPLDRPELYANLVYPRLAYHKGGFRSHLDLLNDKNHGTFYGDADYAMRRKLLNIWNLPSASGMHLANILLGQGYRVRIINNIDSEYDLFKEAYEGSKVPPLVGISSTFYLSFKEVGRVAKRLRGVDSDMDIVLGGAYANAETIGNELSNFERPMRKYGIRYVLHAFNSEGDLVKLLAARKGNKTYDEVDNLCYIDGKLDSGSYMVTEKNWKTPLLDETPDNWHNVEAPFLNRTVQIRTASGCPFSCSFCSYPTTAGGWKTMSENRVRSQLESVLKIPGIDVIIFIDDTFNVPPHRFKELLKIFCDYDFEWFSFLRVQYVDEEIVRLMKQSGCKGVYLGIESSNDVVLGNMNKRAKRADFERGLNLLNRYDIKSLAAFIVGFPGETEKTIRDNIDFIENNGVEFYSLKEFFYIGHTSIHEQREKFGLTGMGNKWAHNTMNSVEASAIKLDMFKEIKKSVSIDPDTSLWYLAYLYEQGFQFDEIARLQTDMNNIMVDQLNGKFLGLSSPDWAGKGLSSKVA